MSLLLSILFTLVKYAYVTKKKNSYTNAHRPYRHLCECVYKTKNTQLKKATCDFCYCASKNSYDAAAITHERVFSYNMPIYIHADISIFVSPSRDASSQSRRNGAHTKTAFRIARMYLENITHEVGGLCTHFHRSSFFDFTRCLEKCVCEQCPTSLYPELPFSSKNFKVFEICYTCFRLSRAIFQNQEKVQVQRDFLAEYLE